ncbi:uncharacterized protein LOC127260796 [Andrographis paniculata]|uniref:uncharacterized protein LOC127260796 n=1 Tax=Andrographis paniculata TaxID=175694 RepID=UPI0021E93ABC|nr:uncharacterized protein LOC127260796 [Andrographis paniculata]
MRSVKLSCWRCIFLPRDKRFGGNLVGLLRTITTDQGTVFTSAKLNAFMAQYDIRLVHFSPYYLQAKGQVEATSKTLIAIIKKALDDNPRAWNDTLEVALWAYRNAKSAATRSTPYRLTYEQNAVLPVEITVPSFRVLKQNEIPMEEHNPVLLHELDGLSEERLQALKHLCLQKKKFEQTFQRQVRPWSFQEGYLVWKVILSEGPKDPKLGKWSPNWEGLYIISENPKVKI